jgi:16S rRNA (adenine1518-N6/adenine1519-N6)-dimethyltransferase
MNNNNTPRKKKQFGQHFLRKQSVVDSMIHKVTITPETNVLEIGCGDGFLTRSILQQTPCKKLVCYEIDHEWVEHVSREITDPRLELRLKNILDVSEEELALDGPWVVLANLPYQITFPIFFMFQRYKHLLTQGVVMTQEEVAQKIVAKRGRPLGKTSLFLQHHFEVGLMDKIEPGAFTPPPKVHSRLVYFSPILAPRAINNEADFWLFIERCFSSPRRTLRNNLKPFHYPVDAFDDQTLGKRAQQLNIEELIALWDKLIPLLATQK